MKTPILFHLGYPKTASTWLQQIFFPNPKSGFCAPWSLPTTETVEYFVKNNHYDFKPERIKELLKSGLEQAEATNLIPVLSNEILTGNPVMAYDWGRQTADYIHQTFPNARILILIREQKSMLFSLYSQYIKWGGTPTLKRFMFLEAEQPGFRPPCNLKTLEYHYLISHYQELFGSDHVLVWPFEYMKQDLPLSLAAFQKLVNLDLDLSEFYEIPKTVNPAYKGLTLQFRRYLNLVCEPGFFGPGGPPRSWVLASKLSKLVDRLTPKVIHKSVEIDMRKTISDLVGDRYAESNRRTSELVGIDLGQLGYTL